MVSFLACQNACFRIVTKYCYNHSKNTQPKKAIIIGRYAYLAKLIAMLEPQHKIEVK
uniref:Uncharacterized protein n=1 Tax=Arundo donax TaxID=35708 RepID=A0A0A9G0W6_ARUDO